MKAYKVELLIIDHDELGEVEIVTVIENQKFPNHCINPHVMATEEADIRDWSDDHPLNKFDSMPSEFKRLFPTK